MSMSRGSSDPERPRRGRGVMADVGDPDLKPVRGESQAAHVEAETEEVAAGRGGEEPALEDGQVLVGARGVDLPERTRRRQGQTEVGGSPPGRVALPVEQ